MGRRRGLGKWEMKDLAGKGGLMSGFSVRGNDYGMITT